MKDCPCGLQSPYADCCGPLVRGTGYADTAEDLMRSRYTAYTQRNWDYLIQTTHSSERSGKNRESFGAMGQRRGVAQAGGVGYKKRRYTG